MSFCFFPFKGEVASDWILALLDIGPNPGTILQKNKKLSCYYSTTGDTGLVDLGSLMRTKLFSWEKRSVNQCPTDMEESGICLSMKLEVEQLQNKHVHMSDLDE